MATDTKLTPESVSPSKPNPRRLPADLWLRLASHGLAIALVIAAIWLARVDFKRLPALSLPAVLALTGTPPATVAAAATATPEPLALPTAADQTNGAGDLTRLADVHTIIPSRPRYEIQQYKVQLHDTLFIIASKYNIKPDTVLWGNPVLAGNPNTLSVGQVLNILPIDGALRIVQGGDTLDKIAKVFHSKVEDIVNFPGNDIDPTDPQLKDGQTVIIPGGWRDVTVWQLPVVSRKSTGGGGGSSGEPGACRGPFSGPTGTFTFVWPANNHYLSGNDYSPTIHPGIDIAAGLGAPIYASDTGVVVFAGLSLYGYGNLVIVDHGNGWQTAYGHLSQINVVCGGAIYQGQMLGLAGSTGNSTGPHLHFEMRSDTYGRVNPWLYLGK